MPFDFGTGGPCPISGIRSRDQTALKKLSSCDTAPNPVRREPRVQQEEPSSLTMK